MTIDSVLKELVGLKTFVSNYAADMRAFGFRYPDDSSQSSEWYLHIQCSWRIKSVDQVITGSFDWFEPVDANRDLGDQWDPATGGSLQELKLRDVFQDFGASRPIHNHTDNLVVTAASANKFGDLTIDLTGGFQLDVFPAGSRGEFWRIFKHGDLNSHFIWEGQSTP